MKWRLYRMEMEGKIAVCNLGLLLIVLLVFLATFPEAYVNHNTATETEFLIADSVFVAAAILIFPVGWLSNAGMGVSGPPVFCFIFVPLNAYLWGYSFAALFRVFKRCRQRRQRATDEIPSDDGRPASAPPGSLRRELALAVALILAAAFLVLTFPTVAVFAAWLATGVAVWTAIKTWGENGLGGGITLSVAILGSVYLAVWALLPMVGPSRATHIALCKNNLSGIEKAVTDYVVAMETPPENIQTLIDHDMIGDGIACPEAIRGRGYFTYFAALENPYGDAMIACDLKGNHGDVRNVLRYIGEVVTMDEEAFQAELAKPENAAFAAALRKVEDGKEARP